ncbi:hypothetical protein GOP47_0011625 [Adiantum capillus-veneris]|uniref:Pectin acetylesterase n=1 Tax=Adiantum capillus-veneris TaxID=13818 RepID=A0A9D4ZGX9_ADICA|nr:hypothetical protein GOP47_0011625 [Adiantum capillus-veneris]
MPCLLARLFVVSLYFLIVTFSCPAQGAPIGIELTLVHGADARGAVCLDGSLPGYHHDVGSGSGSNSWIVHLQGGAWCSDANSCALRAQTSLGSSRFMNASIFQGILSNSPSVNPYFYNWNRVKVRYCDGGSFSGDAELPMLARIPGTSQLQLLYYRGNRIWKAVMEDLLARGMNRGSQALLSGESAGGLASLIHCNAFRGLFLEDVDVKCLSDAGIFLDIPDINGNQFVQSYFRKVVTLQNIGNLPKGCTSERDPGQCFLAQHFLEEIYTPTFILQSAYDTYQVQNFLVPRMDDTSGNWAPCKAKPKMCSTEEIDVLQGFRKEMILALNPIQTFSNWGVYLTSCFCHTQSQENYWNSVTQIARTSVVDAVGHWVYKGVGAKYVDCPYPCNPTCR